MGELQCNKLEPDKQSEALMSEELREDSKPYRQFKALTPENLTKELEPYKDALDFALDMERKDVRNIAVTGAYGAGKSSIIESYIQQVGIKKKTLNISLATFDLKNQNPKNELDLETIELKILQQLIHQAHPSQLPKSRFERIEHDDLEWDKTLYHTVISLGFVFVATVFIRACPHLSFF